jgi:hypothetical protein
MLLGQCAELNLWVIKVPPFFSQLLHFWAVICINEELNDLYCSPKVVRATKSRRMRWTGDVARMGESRGVYRVSVEKT